MRNFLAALLLIVSSQAEASNGGPRFDVLAFGYMMYNNTAHFSGFFADTNPASTAIFTVTGGVDFGDGQTFETAWRAFDLDHTYAHGSYTATIFFNAVGYFLYYPANGDGPEDLQRIPINYHYEKLVAITAVPEPSNLAMMLAGLGLLGFMARRRQLESRPREAR